MGEREFYTMQPGKHTQLCHHLVVKSCAFARKKQMGQLPKALCVTDMRGNTIVAKCGTTITGLNNYKVAIYKFSWHSK